MDIAVLSALLIHVVWLTRAYTHSDPAIAKRVRTCGAVASWAITTVLFCLVQEAASAKFNFGSDSGSRQVIRLVTSPENSICYAEIQAVGDATK